MQTTINKGDLVKVLNENKDQIKRGIVVKLTSIGAYVYQRRANQNDNTGDLSPETCEWFPFLAPKLSMELITLASEMTTRSGKVVMPL